MMRFASASPHCRPVQLLDRRVDVLKRVLPPFRVLREWFLIRRVDLCAENLLLRNLVPLHSGLRAELAPLRAVLLRMLDKRISAADVEQALVDLALGGLPSGI